MARIDELLSDFEVLDDWEDRYRHVIELGRELKPLPEADHTAANKVMGCASQVWITSSASGQ
ncbi:MAG: SufE family protein, partial [Aestuariivirga sp.]